MGNRKSHRQFCSICHEVDRVMFDVPDDIWELATHHSQRNNIICLACFTKMADERGVKWDENIQFYPVSQITHSMIPQFSRIETPPQFICGGFLGTAIDAIMRVLFIKKK